MELNATSPAGAVANYSASATDALPASPAVSCTPASGTDVRGRHDRRQLLGDRQRR